MITLIQIYLTNILIVFLFSFATLSQPINAKKSKGTKDNTILATTIVDFTFIAPGVIPFSGYRWQDVAGNVYSDTYRNNYSYDDFGVQVQVTFESDDVIFQGQLLAAGLKPNFAYQLKINGLSGTASNELIGLAGRWWQEEWDGNQWSGGQNLNDKGDGLSPSPNDLVYFARKDEADPTSPTGLNFRYTGYLVFDYFITDENGDAIVNFETNSSYHVLWNTIQRLNTSDDGPAKSATFDPDTAQTAYDTDYPSSTMTIFGEWERLPMGEVYLGPGFYDCQIIMTEESFHGWLNGVYTGQWAAAMGADIQFTIEGDDPLYVQLSSFVVEPGNSNVLVKWVTESELNQAGFEILRSTQQEGDYSHVSDYRENPDLKGQGNSSIRQEYLYIDRDVQVGQSYWYYLVDIDLNGQRTFHGPVHVTLTKNNGLNFLSDIIPGEMMLHPNFPNPFNSRTVIRFDIPDINQVRNTINLAIYTINGQKIRTLYQGGVDAGSFEIDWDGRSEEGKPASSGVYFVVLSDGDRLITGKIILIR